MLGFAQKICLLLVMGSLSSCQDAERALREDELSVLDPEAPFLLGELVLSPAERELMVGERVPLNAILFLPYQRTEDLSQVVSWESSHPQSLGIESQVDGAYMRALTEGAATLTARYKEKSASATFRVGANTVENAFLGLAQKSVLLSRLQSSYIPSDFYATLIGMLRDGSSKDISAEAEWESSDPDRLKVVSPGRFLALRPGQVKLSVRWSGKVYQQELSIQAVDRQLDALELSAAARIIALQTPESFRIEAIYNDGTRTAITPFATLSIGDQNILRWENSPNFRLLGLQEGSTTLRAEFEGKALETVVRVVDPLYQTLRLEPSSSPTLALGGSEQWKAYLVLSDGSQEDVSSRVVWTSSASAIAEVSPLETEKGRIYGRRLGAAILQANFFGLLQTAAVTVGAAKAKTLEIQALATGTLGLYLSRDYKAFAEFTDGIRREVTSSVVWSIDSLGGNAYFDPSAKGRLVSTASGGVRARARLDSWEASSELTIGPVSPVVLQILGAETPLLLSGPTPRALTARVMMSDGQQLDKTAEVEWTYTTTGEGLSFAAFVENTSGRKGLCTPLRPGKISVRADFSGLQTSKIVEVLP